MNNHIYKYNWYEKMKIIQTKEKRKTKIVLAYSHIIG